MSNLLSPNLKYHSIIIIIINYFLDYNKSNDKIKIKRGKKIINLLLLLSDIWDLGLISLTY